MKAVKPKADGRHPYQIRFHPELWQELREVSRLEERPVNNTINRAIRIGLRVMREAME